MSEHQIYEFRCLDGTLSLEQREELRAISTRAEITSTLFKNEYNWGDLRANPRDLVAHYFDAFFYLSNWGARYLTFKFPASLVPLQALAPYLLDYRVEAWQRADHTLLEIAGKEEDHLDQYWEYEHALNDLIPIREQIMTGDYRALFMLWIDEVATWEHYEHEDDSIDLPPIPAGLDGLELCLMELAEVFSIDLDLVQAAASFSPKEAVDVLSDSHIKAVLEEVSQDDKDALLHRVAKGDHSVRHELLGMLRQDASPWRPPRSDSPRCSMSPNASNASASSVSASALSALSASVKSASGASVRPT